MLRSAPLIALLSVGLGIVGPGPGALRAQDATGALRVTVRAADTGRPLAGAQVVVPGAATRGTTDASGVLRLPALRPGSHAVEARFLGYAPQSALVVVESGRAASLVLELPVQPIQLAAVRVRSIPSVLKSSGFLQRQAGGFGTFITRSQIEEMQPRFLSDVLRRVAGMTLQTTSFGGTSRASMRGAKVLGGCPIQYYVDGTMTHLLNVDEVQPQDVEGLEIYRGAATIPAAYNKGTALCGVILIWTRTQ